MTEAEWRTCAEPEPMLALLWGRSDMRKWRLFAVECCRQALDDFQHEEFLPVIECGSVIAEDHYNYGCLGSAREVVERWLNQPDEVHFYLAQAAQVAILPHLLTVDHGRQVVRSISAAYRAVANPHGNNQFATQANLLREIFGNPFYQVAANRHWLTSTVTALAQHINESRDFGAMPILADALQDAGCENADILEHCRGPGPHVRGCWVVDLVLGKA